MKSRSTRSPEHRHGAPGGHPRSGGRGPVTLSELSASGPVLLQTSGDS